MFTFQRILLEKCTRRLYLSSILTGKENVAFQGIFCNETSTPATCNEDFCECVHRIKVGLGDVVELVLVSNGYHGHGNHPMHLHGHSFYVLGMEKVQI